MMHANYYGEYLKAFGLSLGQSGAIKSAVLNFVTVFEPLIPFAQLISPMSGDHNKQQLETLLLVNKVTLPSLNRLIINFNNHRDEGFASLGLRLQEYTPPLKVSAIMTSAVKLNLLQPVILPLVDHLNFTITSIPDKLRDYSPLETISGLESLTLVSSVTNRTACGPLLTNILNMINNNDTTLETMDLQLFPMTLRGGPNVDNVDGDDYDGPMWCIPSLKRLACQDMHLASFPSATIKKHAKSCRNLQVLNLKFNRLTKLGTLKIPALLTNLTSLQVLQIPDAARPDDYLSFFRRLQNANPFLKDMTFTYFSAPEALVLAPVLARLTKFKVHVMQHRGGYGDVGWPMIAAVAPSLAEETKDMPVNRLLKELVSTEKSSIQDFSIAINPHELISYPLLKSIALSSCANNTNTNDNNNTSMMINNESATSAFETLWVNATWPRVCESIKPTQLENRNQCLGFNYMSPHVAFQVYEPVCNKPVGDEEDQSYLQDLFFGFHEDVQPEETTETEPTKEKKQQQPFKLTDFCYLIRDVQTLGEVGRPHGNPLAKTMTMAPDTGSDVRMANDVSEEEEENERVVHAAHGEENAIDDDMNSSSNSDTESEPVLPRPVRKSHHERKNSKVKMTMFLDVPEWQQVEMQVKIDLNRLRELLLRT